MQKGLKPIFTDAIEEEILKIYAMLLDGNLQDLIAQIHDIDEHIAKLEIFDYTVMLAKYDLPAINSSVIQYFKALQTWTGELMSLIEDFERRKENTIQQFTAITLALSKKYAPSPALTDEENTLLRERQEFFRARLTLGMHAVKERILRVKRQADDLEARIDATDSLKELAVIADERRAEFAFVAENTARIITDAMRRIEFFEEYRDFAANAVKILTGCTESYRAFRTSLTGQLRDSCAKDSIESNLCEAWCREWAALRLRIERMVQPLLAAGLDGTIGADIPERIASALEDYRKAADKFFLDERKGIYQEYAFTPGGSLQEKFKAESMMYKCTSDFQRALQEVIFSCEKPAERIFILKWANGLLDVQIDEILAFVADNDLQTISAEILEGFVQLKIKNYDVYLSDAKSYSEELSRREKEYNSLVFRMRKDLAKGDAK